MSLSPPISESIESPIFEASLPLNLRQSPRDETRYNFGLFGEVSVGLLRYHKLSDALLTVFVP